LNRSRKSKSKGAPNMVKPRPRRREKQIYSARGRDCPGPAGRDLAAA
jgi:hypothetical protein